jgi:protein TonB
MAVATATVRPRPRPRPRLGPALVRDRVPMAALACSALLHGALVVVIVLAGHVWRSTQPKAYIVNLVPSVAAVGSPQGRGTTPQPTPPRPVEPTPRTETPRPAPSLPEREPARPSRPTELPERPNPPRESASLPDRSLPARTTAPALPRPGEKELPRVASTAPPTSGSTTGRSSTPPPPPPPRGLPTGSPQGLGAVSLSAGDFPFAWYLRQIQSKIGEKWDVHARDGIQPQVVFEISRDGKVRGLAVEKSSGNPLYDQAAMRAITEAAPFPPLPDDFKESMLRVHLGFNYAGTRG